MKNISLFSLIISLVPCFIPPYAFRLSRLFGTQRVGWTLFATFSLLAVLQLVQSWHPRSFGTEPYFTISLLNLLVPVLLLIGMVHIEALFRERLRVEQMERRLREELEAKVLERTADLDTANEQLQREISLRKQGEAELKKSKQQYRFLFDENPQPMWIYDRFTFRILDYNTASLRYYGYSSIEFAALTAMDLWHPSEAEDSAAEFAESVSAFQPQTVRQQVKKDGTVIEVETAVLDLTYVDCSARLVVVSDVTAQRSLQKQSLHLETLSHNRAMSG
jgi:PAS domain S-box-containing protein